MTDPTGSRTVVIGAASRHGSTTEIAVRIEHTLRERLSPAWTVTLADLSDLRTFEDADAVVLGSAVYLGHWLRPAIKALHALGDAPLLDLWLFSSGPISKDMSENARIITADEMVEKGCATDHMVFAGRLDTARLSWWERLAVRAAGAVSGDRRDWTQVDAWA
ncbi:MAG: flavodoxin domain-containing protein, partial [Aeromicrobium sp.]